MKTLRCELGIVSDPGNRRPQNQDSVIVRRGQIDQREFLLLAVADGMGGMSHGDQASYTAALLLGLWWDSELPILLTKTPFSWEDIAASLSRVIDQINWTIRTGDAYGEKSGTTLSLLFFLDGHYLLKQVGDSRIYLLRDGQAYQLTKDQTWCQQEMDEGRLTPEAALTHRMRHVLISALGIREDYICQEGEGELAEEDWLLLCSDGFYNEMSVTPQILPHRKKGTPQQTLDELLTQIKAGQADDNISAILVHVIGQGRRK